VDECCVAEPRIWHGTLNDQKIVVVLADETSEQAQGYVQLAMTALGLDSCTELRKAWPFGDAVEMEDLLSQSDPPLEPVWCCTHWHHQVSARHLHAIGIASKLKQQKCASCLGLALALVLCGGGRVPSCFRDFGCLATRAPLRFQQVTRQQPSLRSPQDYGWGKDWLDEATHLLIKMFSVSLGGKGGGGGGGLVGRPLEPFPTPGMFLFFSRKQKPLIGLKTVAITKK
jgi:hypothetical protein